jgi:hypothetical protein
MRTVLEQLSGSSGVSFGLSVSVKVTVFLMGAALVGVALRRRSAAARHLLWTAALLGALTVPIVAGFIPSWPLRVSVPPPLSHATVAAATPRPFAASRSGFIRDSFVPAAPDGRIEASPRGGPVETPPSGWWGLL